MKKIFLFVTAMVCSSMMVFGGVIAQLPIDGIVYSLSDDKKAMVMPAHAFDKHTGAETDATGDERYTGKVVIPSKVNYKGNDYEVDVVYSGAFSDCPDLTEVVFPATIKELLPYVFGVETGKTSKLTAITCLATSVPKTDPETFGNLDLSKITVTVPSEALDAYKADAVWGKFWKATGVENVQGDKVQGTKVIKDGVLYLMYNGTMYNVQGAEVK
jgi:hypothetical protein